MAVEASMKYDVIIADDLDQHVELLSDTLKTADRFNVVFKAFDGREVIDYLSGRPPFNDRSLFPVPQLVFLDLRMLQVDGFQVLHWIKQQRAPVLPIIVTSFANPESANKATDLGAAAVFNKPLRPEDTLSIIQIANAHFAKSDEN